MVMEAMVTALLAQAVRHFGLEPGHS